MSWNPAQDGAARLYNAMRRRGVSQCAVLAQKVEADRSVVPLSVEKRTLQIMLRKQLDGWRIDGVHPDEMRGVRFLEGSIGATGSASELPPAAAADRDAMRQIGRELGASKGDVEGAPFNLRMILQNAAMDPEPRESRAFLDRVAGRFHLMNPEREDSDLWIIFSRRGDDLHIEKATTELELRHFES